MNHKLVGCPRTWHSLWDEMFSAFTASDADVENAASGSELERTDATSELKWIIERTARQSNDNGST